MLLTSATHMHVFEEFIFEWQYERTLRKHGSISMFYYWWWGISKLLQTVQIDFWLFIKYLSNHWLLWGRFKSVITISDPEHKLWDEIPVDFHVILLIFWLRRGKLSSFLMLERIIANGPACILLIINQYFVFSATLGKK